VTTNSLTASQWDLLLMLCTFPTRMVPQYMGVGSDQNDPEDILCHLLLQFEDFKVRCQHGRDEQLLDKLHLDLSQALIEERDTLVEGVYI
jgi:hypothetical protein